MTDNIPHGSVISALELRPNKPRQPTPQAASKIGAILKPRFGSVAFPIYDGAANPGRYAAKIVTDNQKLQPQNGRSFITQIC